MPSIKIICLLIITFLVPYLLKAQSSSKKPKPVHEVKVARFKPPDVKTSLGKNSGPAAEVTIDEANQLLNLPLKISDDKNNIYTVNSYQFMYKKRSLVENEETGKKEPVFTTVADLFKITPLPPVWRNNIEGSVQKQEEFYFFDIIVKDKLERKFFAPDIKIKIN